MGVVEGGRLYATKRLRSNGGRKSLHDLMSGYPFLIWNVPMGPLAILLDVYRVVANHVAKTWW